MIRSSSFGGLARPFAACIAGVAALLLLAIAAPARAAAWHGQCDVRFHGTSSLHDFAGDARCKAFKIDVDASAGGTAIIPRAEVAVATAGMATGNRSRDGQMRKMFQSDTYPDIRADFGRIDPERFRQALRAGPGGRAPLDFTLTIRDIARPVHGVAGNLRETGGGVTFDVDYDVSLSDYRLVPPKAFFGLVRVGDKVMVRTTVRLETGGGR